MRISTTNWPAVKIGKIAGFNSVSVSSNTNLSYLCWIQIESNIVVTVEIHSCNNQNFNAATSSLQTLKINKREIMNIVKSSMF